MQKSYYVVVRENSEGYTQEEDLVCLPVDWGNVHGKKKTVYTYEQGEGCQDIVIKSRVADRSRDFAWNSVETYQSLLQCAKIQMARNSGTSAVKSDL